MSLAQQVDLCPDGVQLQLDKYELVFWVTGSYPVQTSPEHDFLYIFIKHVCF
jgi:hypothetical protein